MKLNISTIKTVVCSLGIMLAMTACNSDLDHLFTSFDGESTLSGTAGDIILSADNTEALALSLSWTGDGKLAISNPDVKAPVNAAESEIQLSASEDFTNTISVTIDKGHYHHQFTCGELNSLLGRIDFPAETLAPLYIRVKQTLAKNITPEYSTTLTVMVKTFRVHLNIATMLDKDRNETAVTLASPEENGVYSGFVGAGGWYNWWLLENNGLTWGNLGEDGKSFYASSADNSWNFWYPGESGCYYTTVNTVEGWWSALFVKTLSATGDVQGEMTYNRKTNQWTLPITSSAARTISITINGDGLLFDRSTTADGPGKEQSVGFGGHADNLSFGNSGSAVNLSVPAGNCSLILDLNNPEQFTIAAGEATQEEEVSQQLYFSGLVEWDEFNDYLTLYDEELLAYGGAHYINSEWGYRAYTEKAWNPSYKAAEGGDPLYGSLVLAESDGNIPAPESGLYVMDFRMKGLTYELTKVESVTFAGLNDDWSETEMTQSADNPEVYTAVFTKQKETPWGVKVLINHNWGLFFGGGNTQGTLYLGHSDSTSGFTGDNDLTIGKQYTLTVDLGKQTYTYTEN